MFNNFIESLPAKVRSTNDFEYGTRFRKKENALLHRYIEVHQLYKKYIIIDIDDVNQTNGSPDILGSAFLWEEKRLPPPTYIVINPYNARCHYFYELRTPVYYTENARRAPQKYYENTDIALTSVLKADTAYLGKFAKNPMHDCWKTIYHDVKYDLEDFQEWGLDLTGHKKKRKVEGELGGRNTSLFDNLREWSYKEVKKPYSYIDFQHVVDCKAQSINKTFIDCQYGVLPAKEALTVSKSVGTWTWRNQATIGNGGKNRGVMKLPLEMSLKAKQAAGAAYAHSNTTAKKTTRDAVIEAAIGLKTAGMPLTQKIVALRAEVSPRTVASYWKEIDREVGLNRRWA